MTTGKSATQAPGARLANAVHHNRSHLDTCTMSHRSCAWLVSFCRKTMGDGQLQLQLPYDEPLPAPAHQEVTSHPNTGLHNSRPDRST